MKWGPCRILAQSPLLCINDVVISRILMAFILIKAKQVGTLGSPAKKATASPSAVSELVFPRATGIVRYARERDEEISRITRGRGEDTLDKDERREIEAIRRFYADRLDGPAGPPRA